MRHRMSAANRALTGRPVVMPAYNAEKTLARTYRDIPKDVVDDVILVDDASRDRTVEVARRLGSTSSSIRRTAATAATRRRATARRSSAEPTSSSWSIPTTSTTRRSSRT